MIWKDRIKQYPHRYTLTNVNGATYDFAEVTGEVTEAGTPVNAENLNAIEAEIANRKIKDLSLKIRAKRPLNDRFDVKSWTGLSSFEGDRIWTDGINIYYSDTARQRVLDVATSTWSAKTWTGLPSFEGDRIWTDGTDIYYSSSSNQYVLDVATSTWTAKTWTGLTSFNGNSIWTDGTNIYYSSSSNQYVLDVATSTWSAKSWTGLTSFNGRYIWTDGTNIYHSSGILQRVLDVATSTWSAKSWTGIPSLNGNYIWTDGTNIYYSDDLSQYVLDVATSTWSAKSWTGLLSFNSNYIWTDGTNIYCSFSSNQYVLIPKQSISGGGKNRLLETISDEYQLRGSANVLTSAWAADSTYAAYPYRAAVTVTGLTANHTGLINFDDTALALGVMKDGGKTYDGGFYIYASAVPSSTITVESYVFWRT